MFDYLELGLSEPSPALGLGTKITCVAAAASTVAVVAEGGVVYVFSSKDHFDTPKAELEAGDGCEKAVSCSVDGSSLMIGCRAKVLRVDLRGDDLDLKEVALDENDSPCNGPISHITRQTDSNIFAVGCGR